jgi:hypothetical protein
VTPVAVPLTTARDFFFSNCSPTKRGATANGIIEDTGSTQGMTHEVQPTIHCILLSLELCGTVVVVVVAVVS